MQQNYKTLKQLFIPIFLETLFLTLVGSVDTLMLSTVGDNAVGGVGTANTYMSLFTIGFTVICSGITAVMTQYIGAGKHYAAKQAGYLGLIFNGAIGIVISLVLIFFSSPLLRALGVSDALFIHADIYIKLVGGTCVLNALIPIFNAYLRSFGYTKEPLVATVVSNVVNVSFNALFLFVFDMGVLGVALATVIARVSNLLIALLLSLKIKVCRDEQRVSSKLLIKQAFSIGFPAAMETALYNVAMTLIMKCLNSMDAEGFNVTARTYAMQVTNFTYIAGVALAQANAIITGWRIGEKKYDICYRGTLRTAKYGAFITIGVSAVFAFLCQPLMRIFTSDADMIRIIQYIFIIDIVLEIGRVSNLIFGAALKTCGDATYTVTIAVVFMFLFATLGTYVLGLQLEMYVIGAWIAMAADEVIRAVLMFRRWKSRKWQTKVFIK